MRLVLDALAARFGGTATFVVQLARALDRTSHVDRMCIVTGRDSIVAREIGLLTKGTVLEIPPRIADQLPLRIGWEALCLPALIDRVGAEALFTFSGMVPHHPRQPVYSFLSNSIPFERPGRLDWLRRAAIVRTAARSTRVYVPSRHMRALLGKRVNADVLTRGVDRDQFRPAPRSGLEILCVGDFYAHKRHDLALQAWSSLAAPRPTLRLLGNPDVDPRHFRSVEAWTRPYSGVVIEKSLPHVRMPEKYRAARVLLITSEHESFSMPLAEAMACGVPAVARDHPALHETGGEGAVYVRGNNPADWTRALETLLHDENRYSRLRDAALSEARRFSWEVAVSTLVADRSSTSELARR